MSNVFPIGSHQAYSHYVQSLSDAIKNRDWVYDPSFALHSDQSIYEKVLRDPVTAHAILFRKHLIAGATVRVVPASERLADEAAAGIVEDILKQVSGFTDARICLADAVFHGSAYAMIVGRRKHMIAGAAVDGVDPMPQQWWVPERLEHVDRRRFRLAPHEGGPRWEFWSVDRRAYEPLTRPEWFLRSVYEAKESSLGYGRGLLDTLFFYQSAKARLLQDLLNASERFGQGMITVGIENLRASDGRKLAGDQRSGSTVAEAWQTELTKQRARHVIVHDARDEVMVVNGLGEGWQLMQWIAQYLDNALVTAVLGSTLPTIEGNGGSRALGEVQENSTESLVQADRARLADDMTRDLLGAIWRNNRDAIMGQVGPANMPTLAIDQRKREDPKEAAELIKQLLDAGVPLRSKEIYEKTGFTQPLPGDDVIGGQPAGGMGDQLGGLGMDPFSAPPGMNMPGAMPPSPFGGFRAKVNGA